MGVDEEAVGRKSAAEARAAHVKPSVGKGREQPVRRSEVLSNIKDRRIADEVCRLQNNLDHRLLDQQLIDELAECQFSGHRYERFEAELIKYAHAVLCGWLHSGYIFKLAADRHFRLHPTDAELEALRRDPHAREELANSTIALALPRFKQGALIEGGWKVDGGAKITTYFMGACMFRFPNEFRRQRAYQRRYDQAWGKEATRTPRQPTPAADPASITVGLDWVRRELAHAKPREQAIVGLRLDGYSYEEIVDLLDETSTKAVEDVLYRWRLKQDMHLRQRRRKQTKSDGGDVI